MSAFSKISTNDDKVLLIKSLQARDTALHGTITSSIPNITAVLRGDVSLLRQAKLMKVSMLTGVNSYLTSINSTIGDFYKERRLGDVHDIVKVLSRTLLVDILGTSRTFEDLLEPSGEWDPATRFHFCRTLRKVGVYSYGAGLLYQSTTSCRARSIKYIIVDVLPSSPRVDVPCYPDSYEYVRNEARRVGYTEFTVPKGVLKAVQQYMLN